MIKGSVIQFLLSQVRTSTEALIGGKVYFYQPGTTSTTGIKIWLDEEATLAANNPYTLDADATAQIYASGKYRIVIKDALGVTQFDRDNVSFPEYFFDPYEYDALLYGSNTFTQATIESALTTIGTSNKATLLIRPGTWPIISNADWSAYTNVTFKIVPGAVISHGAFTVKLPTIEAGLYKIFDGSAAIIFPKVGTIKEVVPQWFGAVADGVTSDSGAIQKAIDSVLTYGAGGTVFIPPGNYYLASKLTVANSGTKGFKLYGAGEYSTILKGDATIAGDLIAWTCTGPPSTISDLMITTDSIGNLGSIIGLHIDSSNGIVVSKLWVSACFAGIKISNNTSNIRMSDIQTELSFYNLLIDSSDIITVSNFQSHQSVSSGIYVTGTPSAMSNRSGGGLTFSNLSFYEEGYGGDGAGGAFVTDSPVSIIINGIVVGETAGNFFTTVGVRILSGATDVYISNPDIRMCQIAGISHLAGNLTVVGGIIDRIGYYDQSTPHITYGIISGGLTLKVVGTTINSEGYGIYSTAGITQLIGVQTVDCSDGGVGGTSAVNSTTGNVAIFWDPQANSFQFQMIGCNLYNAVGTGKTGLKTGAISVTTGNVKLLGNSVFPTSFATPFSSLLTNAQLLTYDVSNNTGLLTTENSGSSAIASGATSVVINHGLSVTPLAEHITITGTAKPTTAVGTIWVDTITATQFTVNVDTNPGVSGYPFGWKARIK